jgi:PAS domain S-box-containing protein
MDLDHVGRISAGIARESSWEKRYRKKDGTVIWARVFVTPLDPSEARPTLRLGVIEDITERKRAEEELRESEERYRALFQRTSNPILVIDTDGNYIGGNNAALQFLECTEEQLTSKNVRDTLTPGEQAAGLLKKLNHLWESGGRIEREYDVNGKTKVLDLTITPCMWHGRRSVFGLGTDITERKRTEEELRKNEASFQDLFHEAPVGYFEYDAQGRITRVNQTELDMLGYPLEEMIGQPVWKFIVEEETARQQILAKLAGAVPPFRGFERTYRRKDGTIFPVLIQDRLMKDEQGNITGIRCAIQDITERKQAEEKLLRTLESLRKAFGTIIKVMVSAVEVRDPYTAGHQIRSADLARTIAKEMGLPQEKIDGIRMAGSIHDIGKLSIPAEILSKPTRLTEIEFSLIKEHSRSGYEILKDVESPWPLAEIVYQHHERMDGSGYPRNLKGDDILMEARIMAVADVVESMASHRPYRAGLGIDAALEEISKNRDILYDPEVSDACLRLFQEKGYRFN